MRPRKLFSITTTGEVATHLKVSAGEINHLVSRLDKQYFRRSEEEAGRHEPHSVRTERKAKTVAAKNLRSHLEQSSIVAMRKGWRLGEFANRQCGDPHQ